MTRLTDTQIQRWQIRQEERLKEAEHLTFHRERDTTRRKVSQGMLALLDDFLTERVSLEDFKSTFDTKTRTEWDVFGFKGTSGAMFLNTVVKHIPDQPVAARQLRQVLPVPESVDGGRRKMQVFYDYLARLIHEGKITRRQVQPARVPFFVSGWWHLQNRAQWPVFYISARRSLQQDEVYTETNDSIADYFTFRQVFLELAESLSLDVWELEHLLAWYDDRDVVPAVSDTAEPDIEENEDTETTVNAESGISGDETLSHTHIQWLLAQIGRKLGCKVWIAANDRNRVWNGERLGDLSVDSLPNLGLDAEIRQIINLIDVIWIQGRNRVAAAFEIESTTSVYSGILRMADLVTVAPNLSIPLYIVAPESRMSKVRKELSRPTFQSLGLHEQCGFFAFETLVQNADAMMRWAGDPSAIDRLAAKVESTTNW